MLRPTGLLSELHGTHAHGTPERPREGSGRFEPDHCGDLLYAEIRLLEEKPLSHIGSQALLELAEGVPAFHPDGALDCMAIDSELNGNLGQCRAWMSRKIGSHLLEQVACAVGHQTLRTTCSDV
jgi:hypothetical protein